MRSLPLVPTLSVASTVVKPHNVQDRQQIFRQDRPKNAMSAVFSFVPSTIVMALLVSMTSTSLRSSSCHHCHVNAFASVGVLRRTPFHTNYHDVDFGSFNHVSIRPGSAATKHWSRSLSRPLHVASHSSKMDASSRSSGDGSSLGNEGTASTDPSFIPSSPATTTTEFLAGIWELIAQGNSMVKGVRCLGTCVLFRSLIRHVYLVLYVFNIFDISFGSYVKLFVILV
jgi:hypothetical protein